MTIWMIQFEITMYALVYKVEYQMRTYTLRFQRLQLQSKVIYMDFRRGHNQINLILIKPLVSFHWLHMVSSNLLERIVVLMF